ncbi:Hypothetical predicted protein [Xyrichtys novacula]|uniref:Uncharacterized protein n=1 Tax=Xyrichtys novacula TaxID=13765 RepID=A0AAV1HNE5_XYRNO|nr:Hypothetical predicted protein [Xyrichtys novacula]
MVSWGGHVIKASVKKWVLRADLKPLRSVHSWMYLGREFQRVGMETLKARYPRVQCLVLVRGERRFASAERRGRFSEVRQVGGGQVMEGLKGEEEDLELNLVGNRKLVKLTEDGNDVVVWAGAGEKSSGGETVEEAIAVVQSGGDERVYYTQLNSTQLYL